jgi:hypothetical protein
MGAINLLSLYGLSTTTLGAYRGFDYTRIHALFDPLMILVIWGTFLVGTLLLIQEGPAMLVQWAHRIFRRRKVRISTGYLLLASISGIGLGLFIIRSLLAPGLSSVLGVAFFFVISAVNVFRYFYTGKVQEKSGVIRHVVW